MPPRTKKKLAKESQMRILVRDDSCTFLEPVATSSPNLNRVETKSSGFGNAMSLQRSLERFCEKEIKGELLIKENSKDELKKRCELFLMKIDPDIEYYSCTDMKESNKGTNKRLREEDILMPPPSMIQKGIRKISKKPRNESEGIRTTRSSSLRTRSSTRLLAHSNNKENLQENEPLQSENNFTEFKTPAAKGFLRRNRHIIATVTPGPNIDAPQTILRRPNPGETAISLSGSPLLVSSEQTSFVPQITIPLEDGRVMAVLAKDGLNPSDFPSMDERTLSRLKLLHEFLGKL